MASNVMSSLSSFVEWRDLKAVYRRYHSLYFCFIIEKEDNELIALEVIQRYVELLNVYFGSVCELDLALNFEKAYFLLNELILGGEIQETSNKIIIHNICQQDWIQEKETPGRKFKNFKNALLKSLMTVEDNPLTSFLPN